MGLDDDLEAVALVRGGQAVDRIDWTSHETMRVQARATRGRHQEVAEPHALANQARHVVVRVGTGAGALIAARAPVEVEDKELLGLEQSLFEVLAQPKRGGLLTEL